MNRQDFPSPAQAQGTRPLPERVARPTYWPPLLALAMTLALLGPVTAPLVGFAGLIFSAVALAGWIGDLLHG
ncbi:MAG TPA: hypothetical protein VKV74_02680 [Bryobacteraceae bacterium]|nr:hypothetical protein [Bryobacteraceae bacterium]